MNSTNEINKAKYLLGTKMIKNTMPAFISSCEHDC